jgi:hypothetical protein
MPMTSSRTNVKMVLIKELKCVNNISMSNEIRQKILAYKLYTTSNENYVIEYN